MELILVSSQPSDLIPVLAASGVRVHTCSDVREAVERSGERGGVLVPAEGYPAVRTAIDASVYETAARRGIRLYVEYPRAVPDLTLGEASESDRQRIVVSSCAFAPRPQPLRILSMHRSHVIACTHPHPHLVRATVAGFETAVYGLPERTDPVLFEHGESLLVATTNLSGFVTGRYAPVDDWALIWGWIIGWVSGGHARPELRVAPAVAPSYAAEEPLPDDAETAAFGRGTAWYRSANVLIPSSRADEARRRLENLPDGTGPGPDRNWPAGDGSCGMIEGASSTIYPDGSQAWRYHLRSDCMGEASMALAAAAAAAGTAAGAAGTAGDASAAGAAVSEGAQEARRIAMNLNDFIYTTSVLSGGPRSDPASPSYGLIAWTTLPPADGVYYGDDNARTMLATMTASALLGTRRWDGALMRCLLANLRTAGPLGFRGGRLEEPDLQRLGWRHYHDLERVHYAPHYESWLWACYLAAYRHTGYELFLQRATTAIRMTMEAYPDQWRWTNGIQQERARMLLPLAWLVRADDRPPHREWLRFMAGELLRHQDASGAIAEELGSAGHGSYGPPRSNEEYGTAEAPLIQENGDPLCDLLYTTNFALVGLHEAAAATGEARYQDAEDRLVEFLCRIQIRSATHPELDGGWFRAFDFGRWDYWASNADSGWGAWSIESGWTQGWITAVLGLRRLGTSLWDLHGSSTIGEHLPALLPVMLPTGQDA